MACATFIFDFSLALAWVDKLGLVARKGRTGVGGRRTNTGGGGITCAGGASAWPPSQVGSLNGSLKSAWAGIGADANVIIAIVKENIRDNLTKNILESLIWKSPEYVELSLIMPRLIEFKTLHHLTGFKIQSS